MFFFTWRPFWDWFGGQDGTAGGSRALSGRLNYALELLFANFREHFAQRDNLQREKNWNIGSDGLEILDLRFFGFRVLV